MVQTVNLKKAFGARVLFQEINVKLDGGKRYGLIGANGAGKTTFLNILSGKDDATEGEVQVQNGKKVGTLSQNQFAYEEYSLAEKTYCQFSVSIIRCASTKSEGRTNGDVA